MARKYKIGQSVRSSAEFRAVSAGKPLTDPTTIKFKLRDPGGTETVKTHGVDGEVVKDAVGKYHCDFTVTKKGEYWGRWTGEGALVTADEDLVEVEPSQFTTP